MSSRAGTLSRRGMLAAAAVVAILTGPPWVRAARSEADPLPSWNDGSPKRTILDFVGRVTREGGPAFVAPADRVAVFDNDGTLWAEQPIYFQVAFALDCDGDRDDHEPDPRNQRGNGDDRRRCRGAGCGHT